MPYHIYVDVYRRGMGARISCAHAGVNVHPKVFESTHKLRLRWGSPHLKSVGEADTFVSTKAILSRLLIIEPQFRLVRQAASDLRNNCSGFSQGEAPLAGLPLFKNSPPDCLVFRPLRRATEGRCPWTLPAPRSALDPPWTPWRIITALSC